MTLDIARMSALFPPLTPLRGEGERIRQRPLHPAAFIQHSVIPNAGDVARLPGAGAFQNLKDRFRRSPFAEQTGATPVVRDELENFEIGQRLTGSARDLLQQTKAPLGVDERAVLFAPA